jgi:hypothetical protein
LHEQASDLDEAFHKLTRGREAVTA